MEEFDFTLFDNGIRSVYKHIPHTQLFHCGFVLDIGSRDEQQHQQGLAHFWEHMAFKGTQKRKAFHILNRLESVGGEINAYTTKEKIYFYASVLSKHHERAIELLTDILFRSTFPDSEAEKERNVILEEMAMYNDMPEEAIIDEFDGIIFKDHPLGNNILGTEESVNSFKKNDFEQFLKENIDTERIVFSAVGNIASDRLSQKLKKYLTPIPKQKNAKNRLPFANYHVQHIEKRKNTLQAHCALGTEGLALSHEDRLPLFMLTNILGGPGLTSRLNMALRERNGLVYSIEASYTPYLDTGIIGIYFGTDEKRLQKCIRIVHREINKLKEKKLGTTQLNQAKEQIMGNMVMAEERNASLMQIMGKSLLDSGKIQSLDDLFEQIKEITAAKIQSLANEYFANERLSSLIYLPEN